MSVYLGMEELVGVVGEAAALRLVSAHGGERVYVPKALTEDHWLIKTMGETAALALVDHLGIGAGGTQVDLPRGPTGARAQERARLASAIAEGQSANEISRTLGINRRTVFRAKAKTRNSVDPRQLKLL